MFSNRKTSLMPKYDDVLLMRSYDEYVAILRRSVINFCACCMQDKYSDVAETYNVTSFTCSELLSFIDRNLNKKFIDIDEGRIVKK